MKISPRGALKILSHEALVLSRYRDIYGVWTIGPGVTRRAGALIDPETFTGRLTIHECIDLFLEVLPRYERGVNHALNGRHCSQHEYDALVSLAYNVGAGLGPYTNKLISKGEIAKAINLWRANPELKNRRDAEERLARTGVYPSNPKCWVLSADKWGKLLWSSSSYKIELNDYLPYLGYGGGPSKAVSV